MKKPLLKHLLPVLLLCSFVNKGLCQNLLFDKFNSPDYDFVIVSDSQKNGVFYGAASISVFRKGNDSLFQKIYLERFYYDSKKVINKSWVVEDFNVDSISDLAVSTHADSLTERVAYSVFLFDSETKQFQRSDTLSEFFSVNNHWYIDRARKIVRIYKANNDERKEIEEFAIGRKNSLVKVFVRVDRIDKAQGYIYVTERSCESGSWNKKEWKERIADYKPEE